MEEDCDTKPIKLETEWIISDSEEDDTIGASISSIALGQDPTKTRQKCKSTLDVIVHDDYDMKPIKLETELTLSSCIKDDEHAADSCQEIRCHTVNSSFLKLNSIEPLAPEFVAVRSFGDPEIKQQIKVENTEDETCSADPFADEQESSLNAAPVEQSLLRYLLQGGMKVVSQASSAEQNFSQETTTIQITTPDLTNVKHDNQMRSRVGLFENTNFNIGSQSGKNQNLVQARQKTTQTSTSVNLPSRQYRRWVMIKPKIVAPVSSGISQIEAPPISTNSHKNSLFHKRWQGKFKDSLDFERQTHFVKKSYLCERCSIWFSSFNKFRDHLRNHKGEQSLSGVKYETKFTISRKCKPILVTQTDYYCRRCSAKFNQEISLKKHLLKHLLICQYCKIPFVCESSLHIHWLHVHPEEKPYACKKCSSKFNHKHELSTHVERNHFSHSCEECSAKFKLKSNLSKHMLQNHPVKKSAAKLCSAQFVTHSDKTELLVPLPEGADPKQFVKKNMQQFQTLASQWPLEIENRKISILRKSVPLKIRDLSLKF